MYKKTIRDISLTGRRVLMRVDFNVPIKDGIITDETRIRAAIPTIEAILNDGASLVLMSHLGRPKGGKREPEFSLQPVANKLGEILKRDIKFVSDCIGQEVEDSAVKLVPGDILLLENIRFHKEEEGKAKIPEGTPADEAKQLKESMKAAQRDFASKLARLGDVYVNDAFGTAHRAHASTSIITQFFSENVAGLLMEREINYMGRALAEPSHPFVAILGGAKVSDKVAVIENLLNKVDTLLIGGAMAYTFFKAKGVPTGKSLVEDDKVDLARDLLTKATQKGVALLLPVDHVIANDLSATAASEIVTQSGIKDGWMALDIGPETIKLFASKIAEAKTIVWNGPMGCFEMAPFAKGTMAIAQAVANVPQALSIVGGGDSVSAINQSGFADKISHISTGGGASLEFLEGKPLPGVVALSDRR